MPELIPTPPDFSVQWQNPADERLFWARENVHFPDPVKPLDFAFCVQGIESGYRKAAQYYGIPGDTLDRLFNCYVYEAVAPPEGTPAAIAAQLAQAQRRLGAATLTLQTQWDEDWLPEIQRQLHEWENYDLSAASLSALMAHLHETHERLYRMWEVHFQLFFPMVFAISVFEELYQELFETDALAAYPLLAGFPNKTIESDIALWQLSCAALSVPEVGQVFTENTAADVPSQLAAAVAGQAWLTLLDRYLQQYGRRGGSLSMLAASWLEDPTPALKCLQDHLHCPDRDLATELQSVAVTREQRIAEAFTQLEGYPQPVIAEFQTRLQAAQVGYTLKEEHTYWIDFQCVYQARRVCLALGERLVSINAIDRRDDIFYLQLDELQPDTTDYRAVINVRREQEQHFAALRPPPALGTMSSDATPTDPISRAIGKVMGVPPPPPTNNELRGVAGSPGRAQGVAKVLHSLADATKLEPGDVLVACMTTPSWTPLFATVAAIVTDGGGVLSHSAIVAREYGTPAVVGTGLATALIRDGQHLEVDGSEGIVRLLAVEGGDNGFHASSRAGA